MEWKYLPRFGKISCTEVSIIRRKNCTLLAIRTSAIHTLRRIQKTQMYTRACSFALPILYFKAGFVLSLYITNTDLRKVKNPPRHTHAIHTHTHTLLCRICVMPLCVGGLSGSTFKLLSFLHVSS